MRLEGKVALIAGGARGIGAAEAKLFAREGASVAVGDVLETEGHQLAEEIAEAGGEVTFFKLDVTSEEDWRAAVRSTLDRFGKIDVLVNNAGIIKRDHVVETSGEDWDRIMEVNAKGVFLGTKCVVPEMVKAGGGSIVNLSSVAGLVGTPTGSAYGASKGAVCILTKSTAIQYARDGVRANSVHPGPIDTPMMESIKENPRAYQKYIDGIPMGRFGTPEEVANAILFLASDESSYVTGSELVIDGGFTAQ